MSDPEGPKSLSPMLGTGVITPSTHIPRSIIPKIFSVGHLWLWEVGRHKAAEEVRAQLPHYLRKQQENEDPSQASVCG